MHQPNIATLAALKASGYRSRSVKEELRENLIARLKTGRPTFEGIYGYDDTVIPDLERAILARHQVLLLGLRGQAKTRLARLMLQLLDEWMPALAGCELMEDPLNPLSREAKDLLERDGDEAPIRWIHRNDRLIEKLATPDVTVADLIGDADPIKAANLRLPYSDERVIHFGLIPRAHRGLFVLNELPDLQARIQVALFNILQEGDIQIRGFQLRFPLDIQFVFTANPEDYTQRGSIVTPLKDRIESQILTHYPTDIQTAAKITLQEAQLHPEQQQRVSVPALLSELLEQVAFEARHHDQVDARSGVSARLSISAYECLVSTAERRLLRSNGERTTARVADLNGTLQALTGKMELVFEGEKEGALMVARNLQRLAIRHVFAKYFPSPERLKKKQEANPYAEIIEWFNTHDLILLSHDRDEVFSKHLKEVSGLWKILKQYRPETAQVEEAIWAEFILHALSDFSLISRKREGLQTTFGDLVGALFGGKD